MPMIIADNDKEATTQSDIFLCHHSLMAIKEEFSRRFKEACADKFGADPKQKVLAKAFEVSQATVSDWWNAVKMPGLEKLIEICLYLDVCVEWMATGRGPKRPPCVPDQKPELTKEQKALLIELTNLFCNDTEERKHL